MPATLGITDKFGLTAPTGGIVEESSCEEEVEAKTLKDETGTTVRARPGEMVTTTVSLKGRGTGDLSLVTPGALGGDVKVISIKNTETNDDYPEFEMTGKSYADLVES
ncbi:MAG: hypothetical protein ACFUZC_16575 [Chthoniobacteraceae bacterium]